MKTKPLTVKVLQWLYLLVFISVIIIVYVLHGTERPFLDVIRLPTFFRASEDATGITYNQSMTVYHFTFAYFLLIIFIDSISLFLYQNQFLRKISLVSSFFGFFIFGLMFAYFAYSSIILGPPSDTTTLSSFIFLFLSCIFFILDLVTFLIDEEGIYTLN